MAYRRRRGGHTVAMLSICLCFIQAKPTTYKLQPHSARDACHQSKAALLIAPPLPVFSLPTSPSNARRSIKKELRTPCYAAVLQATEVLQPRPFQQ